MTLSNGIAAFDFDPATGSLLQIADLRTGRRYLDDPREARLWRLFAPDDDRWIDRYADNHTAGRPASALTGDTLTLTWTDLVMGDGRRSGIGVVVTVTLPAGADEAMFALAIDNRGRDLVCEVLFPWVGGWHGYEGQGESRGVIHCGTRVPLDPFKNLRRNDGWNILDHARRLCLGFPHVNLPLADLTNGSVGLSYNLYPRHRNLNYDLAVIDQNERGGDAHPSVAWVHRPFTQPGARWESGPVGIAPHTGDWHDSAERMRRWLASWWKAPPLPESLRHAIGFHNVAFREFTGFERRPMTDLAAVAKHGKAHGVDHMILWDMSLLGMYLQAGSSSQFEDTPERIADLRRGLAAAREAGVTVSPLINLRLTTQTHPFWKAHGERWAIRSRYGMPATETLPLRAHSGALIVRYLDQGGAKLCQAAPEFQSWALGQTRRVLDLGFTAVFLDQPFSEDYCFSADHGHPVPYAVHGGACDWINRAGKLVRSHPGSYCIGEVPDIWNTQHLELWWFWDWVWQRPEIFRYVLPASLQSWVIDALDHEDQVGRAFAQGFLLNLNVRGVEGTLADAPELANRVKALAALRRASGSRVAPEWFVERCGLTTDSDVEVTTAVYRSPRGLAVAIGDGDGTRGWGRAARTVRLALAPHARLGMEPGEVAQARVRFEDGSVSTVTPRRAGGGVHFDIPLPQGGCAVVEMETR